LRNSRLSSIAHRVHRPQRLFSEPSCIVQKRSPCTSYWIEASHSAGFSATTCHLHLDYLARLF
jgi:hypothetical protein